MDLRQLLYAVQIAADRNFSRAAEKLHIAQPSLSQQIAKLEKELGVLLFQRSTNSVELTYAGEKFVDKAQKILDMADQLKKEMEDINQMKQGRLVIGSLPMTGSHILPLVLPVFKARYPQIDIRLVEDTTVNLEQLTMHGKTDLSLLTLPLLEQSLHYEPLIEEEICLAVPKEHRFAQKVHRLAQEEPKLEQEELRLTQNGLTQSPAIDLRELSEEPFIVLKKGQGFRQITFDLCKQAGFDPKIVFESGNIETVQSLVAAGMGIAFVPEMITRPWRSHLAPSYLRLVHRPTRTLVIAYKKGRYMSKAAEAFIQTMIEVVKAAKERGEI